MRARWLVGGTAAVCLIAGAVVAERWQARRVASRCLGGIYFEHGNLEILWPYELEAEPFLSSWRSCSWLGTWEGKVGWFPRSVYPEILFQITGQRLQESPDVWEAWLAAHSWWVWDEGERKLVEPWRETTVYRLPDGAKPARVLWKLNLDGCARQGFGLQVLRTEDEFREFLGSGSHRFPVDLLVKWNAIDFSKRMAVVAFACSGDPRPGTVVGAFEKEGVVWVTDQEIGKPCTFDGPRSSPGPVPAVLASMMGGIVVPCSDKPVKYWAGPLPSTVKRETLKPSRTSP